MNLEYFSGRSFRQDLPELRTLFTLKHEKQEFHREWNSAVAPGAL